MVNIGAQTTSSIKFIDLHQNNSKRAYQTRFSCWGFPSKQPKYHKDERLVIRTKELWERNLPQKDILRILNEDGFEINERELRRVRVRHGMLLRASHGANAPIIEPIESTEIAEDASANVDGDSTLTLPDAQNALLKDVPDSISGTAPEQAPYLSQANADAAAGGSTGARRSRKDRRPKDANGDMVKFPSEMTIEKANALLSLSVSEYQSIREAFEQICIHEGIVKKTVSGPQTWERAKDQLIEQTPQLQQVLWGSDDDTEAKKLALDIICAAAAKRIRVASTQMTLAEFKNILCLNPEDSRRFTLVFNKMLLDADFIENNTPMASPVEWEILKKRVWEKTSMADKIRASGKDPEAREVVKAFDKLAQNVRKRLKDDVSKKAKENASQSSRPKQPTKNTSKKSKQKRKQKQTGQSFSASNTDSTPYELPGRASSMLNSNDRPRTPTPENLATELASEGYDAMQDVSHTSQMTFPASGDAMPAQLPLVLQHQSPSMPGPTSGLPPPHRVLGSSLPAAMQLSSQMGSTMLLEQNSPTAYIEQQYVQAQFGVTASSQPAAFHPVPAVPSTLAMFLRLHPSSTFVTNMPVWIGTLSVPSIQELRRAAVEKFPGVICHRVEGIVKHDGGEIPLQIQDDQELAAYLTHIQPNTPTFAVQLIWKT